MIIPNEGEDQNLKSEIIKHFEQLHQEGQLNNHLDDIFKQLFQTMEIDFLRGLPFSFDYIDAISFRDGREIIFQDFFNLVREGQMLEFKKMLEKFPILGTSIVIQEILNAAPPCYYHEVASVLEEKYPENYLISIKNLIELSHKNNKELTHQVNQIAKNPSIQMDYNLSKLVELIEIELTKNPEVRASLIKGHQEDVNKLVSKIGPFYRNYKLVGGNSKMNELFSNPDIMRLFMADPAIIATIIALEIEAKIKNEPFCKSTLVAQPESQQSMKQFNITLGSILSRALKQPAFFLQSCPLNSSSFRENHYELDNLRNYIKHDVFFTHFYKQLEKGLLELCNNMGIEEKQLLEAIPNNQGCHEPCDIQKWEQYEDELNEVLNLIGPDFCKNPHIIDEVQVGLGELVKLLNISPLKEEIKLPTLDELVEKFLCSTSMLHPVIAHLLFDTTHFGVAMTDEKGILKIKLADNHSVCFKELIMACVHKLSTEDFNPSHALVAQQLALRTKQLQYWCVENIPEEILAAQETKNYGVRSGL